MIGMIIDRVKMSPYVSDILIATTDLPEDDKLLIGLRKKVFLLLEVKVLICLEEFLMQLNILALHPLLKFLAITLIESKIIDEV